MPLSHIRPEPLLLPIERPPCPKCQGHMMLATIEPGPSAGLRTMPQVRTFDRYAEALTLLFAARMVDLRFGILVHIRELVHRNDRARLV